ncbi:peptidase [Streptomyces somaliensis]|uniref:peptidase n=1 Tax=Streptomyces somaliensis TaxID=78355 RepID=UPI0020CCADF9|nr:peptidase [Streptomyces somaliensis]MCP9945573.1 peptidase [Streptomyces somaliensis]MCP9974043.1 peptidase [Streptomyces somaliensis]
MKTTRTPATAVAAAVIAPVVLLAASPAYAATVSPPPAPPAVSEPSGARGPSGFGKGRSVADLEKAVAEARKAYDAAMAAKAAAYEKLLVAVSDTTPEALAAAAAGKEAIAATVAHTAAVKVLEEAEAKLAALPDTAAPEARTAAEKAVADARTAVEEAAAEKTAADGKRAEAGKALDDMRVAAFRADHLAGEAVKKAAADLAAAEKALADAKEEEEDDGMCDGDDRLVAELTGLPEKVTAGSTVDLTVRVTNNTGEAVDRAYAQVTLAPGTKDLVTLFEPQYSTGTSATWRDWNSWGIAVNVGGLKPGAHADLRLRLSPAATLRGWKGRIEVSGWYERGDDCGANTTMKVHRFQVVAAPAASPSPQGGTTTPVGATIPVGTTTTATTPTAGTLARTGSSDALKGLALTSGAAVLLGAGAVFATRRRGTTGA